MYRRPLDGSRRAESADCTGRDAPPRTIPRRFRVPRQVLGSGRPTRTDRTPRSIGLVGEAAYVLWKPAVAIPEPRISAVPHRSVATAGSQIFKSFVRQRVQPPRSDVVFDPAVPRLSVEFGKPCAECGKFSLRKASEQPPRSRLRCPSTTVYSAGLRHAQRYSCLPGVAGGSGAKGTRRSWTGTEGSVCRQGDSLPASDPLGEQHWDQAPICLF